MRILETSIGWLAPPDCLVCGCEGSLLCRECSNSQIKVFGERCWRCNSLSLNSRTCHRCRQVGPLAYAWICTNYENVARDLVRAYKFGHSRAGAQPLARIMVKTFLANWPPGAISADYLVVPLPTATSRIRERGFGHSELLAKTISRELHLEYSAVLRRLGQSRQLGSKREDRLIQLADSFVVKNTARIAGRNILLVDDVLTTGGSLISAAKTLKNAGAKSVDAVVFAKRL